MNILTNPNIVYLILVFGFVLAILAMLSPGTGVLELFAFFMLVLAGWGIYNNEVTINFWALGLLVLGVLPFIWALRKSRRIIYLAIALGAFVVGSAYLFQGDEWWKPGINLLLATVVSILVIGFSWVAAQKILEAEGGRPTHDLESLIGEKGEAKTNIEAEGSVQVAGELWSAHS